MLTLKICYNLVNFILCCIYRPPSSNPYRFIECIEHMLSQFSPETHIIIAGDINLDLYNPYKLTYIREYINLLSGLGCFPVITYPSMFHANNPTTKFSLIDQIWVNFVIGSNHLSGIINHLISDHLPTFCMFNICDVLNKIKFSFRQINERNKINFVNGVHALDFSDVFLSTDPDVAFDKFYNRILRIYNKTCPIKTKTKSSNKLLKQPWVTPTLKKCIKKNYRLYNLFIRGLISKNSFNNYKKVLIWVTNRIRMTYYRSKFINNRKNNKKIWKDINGLLGRTNKREVVGVVGDGGEMLTGKSMADKFNEFFSTVAESLVSLVPHVLDNGNHGNHGNVNNRYYNYINSNQRSCFLYPTNIVELLHVFTILTDKCNVLFDVKPTLLFLVKERIFPVFSVFV